MSSIQLSPEHGANPSLLICMICGEGDGIAFLGRLPDDAQAPRKMRDREPCLKCREEIDGYKKLGIVLFGIDDAYEGDLLEVQRRNESYYSPRSKKPEPTPWQYFKELFVIREEAARKMFKDVDFSKRAMFIPWPLVLELGLKAIEPTGIPQPPSTSSPE